MNTAEAAMEASRPSGSTGMPWLPAKEQQPGPLEVSEAATIPSMAVSRDPIAATKTDASV